MSYIRKVDIIEMYDQMKKGVCFDINQFICTTLYRLVIY